MFAMPVTLSYFLCCISVALHVRDNPFLKLEGKVALASKIDLIYLQC